MSFKISDTGSCAPDNIVDNFFFEGLVDTSDDWITTRTGIKKRHILKNQTLLDLSINSAKQALKKANLQGKDIDLIICATMQGDYIVPSHACLVQKAIGADCPAYDLNAACSGFLFAIDCADSFISTSKYNRILVLSSDQLSKFINYQDRATCVLFGDGAGAVVLEKGDNLKYIKLMSKGDKDNLNIPVTFPKSPFFSGDSERNYLFMNGQEIFKFAVSTIVKCAKEAVKAVGISLNDIDYFFLHQANGRILEMAQHQLKQPPDKFPANYTEYGNTSSASIPLLLDEQNNKGALKKGDLIFMSAFGGGLTSGACIIEW